MTTATETTQNNHSPLLDNFLNLGTPESYVHTEKKMLLAAKIEDGMLAQGLNKKEFAELMGQKPSVITKWLSGGHNFTVDTLTDIERVLNIQLLAVANTAKKATVYATIIVQSTVNSEQTTVPQLPSNCNLSVLNIPGGIRSTFKDIQRTCA
jgi:transcriptional regulator with XRE-family HTH domain